MINFPFQPKVESERNCSTGKDVDDKYFTQEGGESEASEHDSFLDDDDDDGACIINPCVAFDFAMASSPEAHKMFSFKFRNTQNWTHVTSEI